MANMFALLADLDDDSFFADVEAPMPAECGQLPGANGEIGAAVVKRAPRETPVFNYDMTAKRLVVAPVHVNVEEVEYPPVAVTTKGQAQKAAAMRLGGSFENKRLVYPTVSRQI